MNVYFLPRPSREDLLTQPLHAIVRDYPETLRELRRHGVSPEDYGEARLEDLEDPEGLLEELETATRWRSEPAEA